MIRDWKEAYRRWRTVDTDWGSRGRFEFFVDQNLGWSLYDEVVFTDNQIRKIGLLLSPNYHAIIKAAVIQMEDTTAGNEL